MKRWIALAGGILIAGAAVWWAVDVSLLPPDERSVASGYGQFVLAVLGILIIVGGWIFKAFRRGPAQPLDVLADLLAAVMRDQWTKAARERRLLEPAPLPIRWRRSKLPVAVPVEAATSARAGQARFDPLPGLTQTTSARLRQGNRNSLHSVYGGLASGRLVIAGPAGSGKSAAAILLLLDALRYRERDPAHIPVPVLFTLHGWDPATTSVRAWLVAKLSEIPGLRRGGTAELLDAGRIAVFLDGLDEINEELRPVALQALSDQATFRLVLLTRSAELVAAAQQGPLVGAAAIELQPITPADAREYLLRPLVSPAPASWQAVADNLSGDPLAKALDNPLMLTLLRDAYQPTGPVDELLDTRRFPTPDDIENHLLDHVLIAAYTRRPGQPPPRYSLDTAQRTLGYIADRLGQDGSRDLAWWTIPQWTSQILRATVAWLIAGPVLMLEVLASGYPSSEILGALAFGSVAGFAAGRTEIKPKRIKSGLWRRQFTEQGILLAVLGTIGALFLVVIAAGLERALWAFLTATVSWLALGILRELVDSGLGDVSTCNPIESWRQDLAASLTIGIFGSGAILLVLSVPESPTESPQLRLEVGLIVLAASAIVALSAAAWPAFISQTLLAVRQRMPWRLMRFMEDARSRQVLRAVGPVYQFRHAKLQDRLAAKVSSPA